MYSIQELKSEIQSKVAWLESNNGPVLHKGWLCNAVMSDHQSVAGDDADFALCCMRHTVTAYVESYFRGIKTREEEGVEQELLPGFERLQKRYIVDRNEEQVIVSVHDMTDEELIAKAKQHRMMGDGHYAHADELQRFMESRRQPALKAGNEN